MFFSWTRKITPVSKIRSPGLETTSTLTPLNKCLVFSYDFEAEYWYSQHLKVQLTGDFSERISLGHVDTAG